MKPCLRPTALLHATASTWTQPCLATRLHLVRHVSSAASIGYNARLQRSVGDHTAIAFPEVPRMAQLQYERKFPTWKKQQVALHNMREAHAMTLLRKYANEDLLWQEARDLNAAQNYDAVIHVLYRVLYMGKHDAPWLHRTTSLFAQQLLLAAISTSNVKTAVEAVEMLAALPSHAVSRIVLVDSCHSAAQLCLQQCNLDELTNLLNSIKRTSVTLDDNLSEQVLRALRHNGTDTTSYHKLVVDLYNSGVWAPSLKASTVVMRSLLYILASSSDRSVHHQLTELYCRMQAAYALEAPDVANYLLMDSCSGEKSSDTALQVATELSFMRQHRVVATVETTMDLVAALLASERDNEETTDLWELVFDEENAAVFPRSTQHVSAALSAAAIHGDSVAAMRLLETVQSRHLPLLDVTYGHVVATAADPRLRAAFVQKYKAANQGNFILSHVLSIQGFVPAQEVVMARQGDATNVGFKWSGTLLQHISKQRQQPVPDVVLMLLQEMQYYGVVATERDMTAVMSTLTGVTLYELYEKFPRVINNAPLAWAAAIQARLRESTSMETMQDAMQVWRCCVWTEGLRLDEAVFASLLYAALRQTATSHLADEVLAQYSAGNDLQHQKLLEEALVHATEAADLPTTKNILRKWTQSMSLSYNAVSSVFRTVEQCRAAAPKPIRENVPTTLSYFGMMVEFPGLFPLDSTVLSQALVLSARSDLFYDCQALLTMAFSNDVALSGEAIFACMDLLTRTKGSDKGDRERLLHTMRRHKASLPMEDIASTMDGLR
ncbi:hypothetical protein, variant 1 [Aphanomyces invadans]|uniref:Uncharacterized protein n=1 Tax=Aphanomyces invadans TaxID=157072 RepID=A0A024TY24_9STRA|nr:hypothetical protein, variant 1 [Aphanomyces invadans]ETV98257.1 hypothetical protein, variant 1 [Aphanomyces invadans]|eukprot:XP_008873132.1 hypothetical protein, variant 1 [Aphanomyces invadans]